MENEPLEASQNMAFSVTREMKGVILGFVKHPFKRIVFTCFQKAIYLSIIISVPIYTKP